ncbi:hypothetical protein C8R44DRAFT_335611 [Mycena epipterygia]|nr:hypothetical protein C8R44DRAFT_335611 [Mycena epipterygia]
MVMLWQAAQNANEEGLGAPYSDQVDILTGAVAVHHIFSLSLFSRLWSNFDINSQMTSPPEAQAFFLNNEPPLDVHVPKIQDFLLTARARLVLLKNEVDALEESIRTHSAVVSSIRRLPSEILCNIFAWTLPHECTRDGGESTFTIGPWRLALVCKRWRECALGYGRLWSSIDINDTDSDDMTADRYPLPALETQLARSRDVPLKVAFYGGFFGSCPHLLSLLKTLVLRWESFTVYLNWIDAVPEMLRTISRIKGQLPLLRRLEMCSLLTTLPTSMLDIFSTAPQLREVFLTSDAYEYDSHVISAPWAQITRFRARFPPKFLLEILQAMPNLVECGLVMLDDKDTVPATTKVIVLPRLRRLYVEDDSFLRFLAAPNLEYLFVHGGTDEIIPFLRRSSCLLKGVGVFYCISPALFPLLHAIPTLLHFHVTFGYTEVPTGRTEEFFAAMGVSGAPSDPWPNLKSLRIDFVTRGWDYGGLYDMVESRWNAGDARCLNSVRLSDPNYSVPLSTRAKFAAWRNAGLDVLADHTDDRNLMEEIHADMIRP